MEFRNRREENNQRSFKWRYRVGDGKIKLFFPHGSLQILSLAACYLCDFGLWFPEVCPISLLWITLVTHPWGSGCDKGKDVREVKETPWEQWFVRASGKGGMAQFLVAACQLGLAMGSTYLPVGQKPGLPPRSGKMSGDSVWEFFSLNTAILWFLDSD